MTRTDQLNQLWYPKLKWMPRIVRCGPGKHLRLAWWSRQNTLYVNDRSNWVCLCKPCMEENNEYWRDMWAQYYNGCY